MRTPGNLLTLAPAAAGMPPDVARCWDRLAQLSLRPLAGSAEPDGPLALAAELLGETDERRRLILTSRTFAPDKRTYDSLARELGISRERVRQLEGDALTRLTQAARHTRYAPLRWRAVSAAQHGVALRGAGRGGLLRGEPQQPQQPRVLRPQPRQLSRNRGRDLSHADKLSRHDQRLGSIGRSE
ncbi:MAG TPA: sigma factor-like helix-turn-helix DNA-binding protein [Streptosporangiaceae bacterium]|nr:sigma factor-like helix-turn-helix DNA-binding protein [Streptosporangiaceae bacterium]